MLTKGVVTTALKFGLGPELEPQWPAPELGGVSLATRACPDLGLIRTRNNVASQKNAK